MLVPLFVGVGEQDSQIRPAQASQWLAIPSNSSGNCGSFRASWLPNDLRIQFHPIQEMGAEVPLLLLCGVCSAHPRDIDSESSRQCDLVILLVY